MISCWTIFFHIWPNGGGLRAKPPKPPLATLSSGCARNGGLGAILPLGQVHALLNGSLRTAGFHGKQRGDFHAVFIPWIAFSLSDRATPLFTLSPPTVFSTSISSLEFWTKIRHSSSPLWFSNVAGLCRLLCLEPLEHTMKAQTVARAGFRAFSLSVPPPLPLLPSPALSLLWLFLCLVMASCRSLRFH